MKILVEHEVPCEKGMEQECLYPGDFWGNGICTVSYTHLDVYKRQDPATGKPYSCCCCRSGDVFKSEAAAIRDGRRWMKEAGRSGTIEAVKAIPRHFEY